MMTALRVEWLKIRTTRMWWILLLLMIGYVGIIAAFITFSFDAIPAAAAARGAPSLEDSSTILALYTLGLPLGYVFPVIVGVLVITTEYRHQTLTPTLLAYPRRGRVLGAKLGVGLALGLLFGVCGLAAGVAGSAPVLGLTGHPSQLGNTDVWASLVQAGLGMSLWAGIGVGLGAMLRNQVAAIVAIIAFSQLVEPLLRLGLNAWSVTQDVAQYLPGAAADAMAEASLYNIGMPLQLLEWWQGGLVMVAYTVVFCVLGGAISLREDVT